MIVEIQCLPSPVGDGTTPYAHVDAAIAVIAASGCHYEVGALGTTFEAGDDEAWSVARRAHEAALASGADSVVSVVKLYSSTSPGPAMDTLVAPFR
jgi:uncharacterized protein YqgV (UPF0045/DUF77 family)